MKVRPLLLDAQARQRIQEVVEYAKAHVYRLNDILDIKNKQAPPPGDKPEHVVNLVFDYRVVFSMEEQPEHGLCKHLSVSVGELGKLPSVQAVMSILEEFGMTTDWTQLHVKPVEIGGGHSCIEVIELINSR